MSRRCLLQRGSRYQDKAGLLMLPENRLTTTQSFRDFFPPHVVTFTSDRSADFKLSGTPTPLTRSQSAFLARKLGFRLPGVLTVRQVHGHKVIIVARTATRRPASLPGKAGRCRRNFDRPS